LNDKTVVFLVHVQKFDQTYAGNYIIMKKSKWPPFWIDLG